MKRIVRGMFITGIPLGQAIYETCPNGSNFDFIVHTRVGSPTLACEKSLKLALMRGVQFSW